MIKYTTRITRITVGPEGADLFNEGVTHVEVEDEAAGEFVVVKQQRDSDEKWKIAIEPNEWPTLRDAIDRIVKECRK